MAGPHASGPPGRAGAHPRDDATGPTKQLDTQVRPSVAKWSHQTSTPGLCYRNITVSQFSQAVGVYNSSDLHNNSGEQA